MRIFFFFFNLVRIFPNANFIHLVLIFVIHDTQAIDSMREIATKTAMNSGRIAVLVAWALNILLATIYIPHVCLLKFAGDRLTSTTPMTTATNGTGDFHRAIMHDHYDYDRIYRSFGTHESYKDVRSLYLSWHSELWMPSDCGCC